MRIRPNPCALVLVTMLSVSTVALAQEAKPDCPPGSWLCDETPSGAAPSPPPELPPPAPTPPPAAAPKEAHPAPAQSTPIPGSRPAPPVIVYQQAPPAPPPIVVVRPMPNYTVPAPPPPVAKYRHYRRWGLNLRLDGVLMDDKQNQRAGMGGMGFSFRVRPERHFALDFGLDLLGGRDYHGNRRSETPFTINAMVYANPRSIVQFYMLGGIGWSHARVELDDSWRTTKSYDYFGGQLGAGLEIRLSPPVSLNFDLVGFIRGRTDDKAKSEPEFTDPETGRTTNTSGGGLFRGGLTFYW